MNICQSSKNGIYFSCQQCGCCCSQMTDGYVFVYEPDLLKMCDLLGMSLPDFARRYLSVINYDFVIWDERLEDTRQRKLIPTLILDYEKKRDCNFLKRKKGQFFCKIYHARPLQCELYPFWSQLITVELNFQRNAESCPGFHAQKIESNYYSPEKIEERVYRERQYEYNYYHAMQQANFDIFHVYPFLKEVWKIRHKIDHLQKLMLS